MCGITGVYRFGSRQPVDPAILDRMTDVLAHRGPDGRGTHLDGELGLGHRRLAIIDLSDEAAQPLANENGTVWLVINGEIYNFRELRAQLESEGHQFRSRCDVEVLVHLYEEAGPRMVERLRGMFAFALWDARRRRLMLARDRFGQKPLYYRLTDSGIHFGSEIKAILEDPTVPRQPDPTALDSYLTYGYVPGPATAFHGIRKLPPGHLLVVEPEGRTSLESYWQLRMTPKQSGVTLTDAAERTRELIDDSTRLRMLSDVPLGAFLSGGIDSSAIVASMCASTEPGSSAPRTFSIGFRESGFDESGFAARVAAHLGTDHRRLEVTAESFAELEQLAWHYGEPFADSSCLPTFALSRLAREHVTVALTGDGGDELFGGYRRYLATARSSRLSAAGALRALAQSRLAIELLRRARRKRLARELEHDRHHRDLSPEDLYLSRLETAGPGLKADLMTDDFLESAAGHDARSLVRDAIRGSDGESLAERCSHADAVSYLPDDILVKVDVASMAHGLECRAPLLDHVLAEHVATLPFAHKIAGRTVKAGLKAAVGARLPAETSRRRKKGFSIPLQAWFRGSLDSRLRDVLLSRRALERGYFEGARVEQLIDAHAAGRVNHQAPLFALLMLELWHRAWIDKPSTEVPATAGASPSP